MEELLTTQSLVAILTLTAMEIVLGIDNIVFIAILVGRLPEQSRARVRSLGIVLALVLRLGLLFCISWIMGLTAPLFSVFSYAISGRDLILLIGGLFLLGKATVEIHAKVEGDGAETDAESGAQRVGAGWVIFQIILLDIVFSLDSVITAVGMAEHISTMVIAMVIAMVVMLISAGRVSAFIDNHPTLKILALAFLLLIGVMLMTEGMGVHVNKGYIYFAMAFSLAVEMLNMRYRLNKRARLLRP